MNSDIQKFADNPAVASAFAQKFVQLVEEYSKTQSKITVSLSGGSTPKLLFSLLAEQYSDKVNWDLLHLFWGDERCVAKDDPESNFGEANRLLISHVSIPPANVHRVHGESDPSAEAVRYGQEISSHLLADEKGVPTFDILLLGMGSDGHTASIFPHQMELLNSPEICEVATHPVSGQKRITVTGQILNAAKNVFFLITGESKASVLSEIVNRNGHFENYPMSFVKPLHESGRGKCTLLIDEQAGKLLSSDNN